MAIMEEGGVAEWYAVDQFGIWVLANHLDNVDGDQNYMVLDNDEDG